MRAYPLMAAVSTVALVVIAHSSIKTAAVAKLEATCIAHEAAPLIESGWNVEAAIAQAVRGCR